MNHLHVRAEARKSHYDDDGQWKNFYDDQDAAQGRALAHAVVVDHGRNSDKADQHHGTCYSTGSTWKRSREVHYKQIRERGRGTNAGQQGKPPNLQSDETPEAPACIEV